MNRYSVLTSRQGALLKDVNLVFASCALDAINKVEAQFKCRQAQLGNKLVSWTGLSFEARLIASAWPRQLT